MPFVTILGTSDDMVDERLLALRRAIVSSLAGEMDMPKNSFTIFIPQDRLPPPMTDDEGGRMLAVRFETGFFAGRKNGVAIAKELIEQIVDLVWISFACLIDVEGFVFDLDNERKAYKAAIVQG